MTMTKDFTLRLKSLDDNAGSFVGIGSPYGGSPDLVGDVIEPGAFKQAIAMQGAGYPLLFAHKQDEPLGIARIEDSKDALIVHGSLVMSDPNAQRVHAHMKAGSLKGLSIGYLPVNGDGKTTYRQDGARVLREIKLFEVSIVAIPAAPRAQITNVKSLGDVQYMLKNMQNVSEDNIADLLQIERELKRLLASGNDSGLLSELQSFAQELKRLAA